MVQELLADLARLEIVLVADGDRLRFHPQTAMTTELVDRLKNHKAEVLAIMAEPWPEAETEPPPCPKCGTLELWENALGRWRCVACDPPARSRKWMEKAERLRKRYGIDYIEA